MRVADLVERLGGSSTPGVGAGPKVTGVHLDSRQVGAGDLFAALVGSKGDGAKFARDAIARGASAVLSPVALDLGPLAASIPQWIHPEARAIAGRAAALVYGEPARGMFVCAVTGTNGKTTTAHLVAHLLRHAGRRPAVLGTAGNRLADGRDFAATHTTPDAPELQRLLVRHKELGGDSVAMEASSHALDQDRLAGLAVDVAIFTNLTRDHLDYHGDFETYARAKEKLFAGLKPTSTAVVNADDPSSARMIAAARRAGARVVTYSARDSDESAENSRASTNCAPLTNDREQSRAGSVGAAEEHGTANMGAATNHGTANAGATTNSARIAGDLCASQVRTDLRGTQLILHGMGISRTRLWLPLAGRYNVENALAAAAAALVSGASPSSVLEGLATAPSAPGRLEPVSTNGRGFTLLVDYAHSEDALLNVCRVLRESLAAKNSAESTSGETANAATTRETSGRLIVVFGCGGDRDKGKRAPMGRVVNALADLAIVTSDNPRTEEPTLILSEIVAGMEPRHAERVVEVDRRRAIEIACRRARPGDVVLIAGKGHETTQTIGTNVFDFDDRKVAAEVLR